MSTRVYGSLARIADFRNSNFDVCPLPKSEWATGDYVVGEVLRTVGELSRIERIDGRERPDLAEELCGEADIGRSGAFDAFQ